MTQQQQQMNTQQSQAVMLRRAAADTVTAMTGEWAKVLPSVCTPERFARVALSCINSNPKLAQTLMTPSGKASLCAAFMKAAEVGLEPNGRDAHIIPYMNHGQPSVQFQLDYKGIVQLARRSGDIRAIVPGVVKEEDEFSFVNGEIHHVIDYKKPTRGKAYAWYVRVQFKDGSEQCDCMNREDVENIRRRSKSPNNGPWVTDYDAMAVKTVFKRMSKWLPLSSEINRAIQLDNEDERDNAALDITPNGGGRFAQFKESQQKLADAFIATLPQGEEDEQDAGEATSSQQAEHAKEDSAPTNDNENGFTLEAEGR